VQAARQGNGTLEIFVDGDCAGDGDGVMHAMFRILRRTNQSSYNDNKS
jgi:hypothetical protein